TDVLLNEYGLIKADEDQYRKLDKEYILRVRKESFGCSCLTNQKQYYLENYPDVVVEKGTLDEVITMIRGGESYERYADQRFEAFEKSGKDAAAHAFCCSNIYEFYNRCGTVFHRRVYYDHFFAVYG